MAINRTNPGRIRPLLVVLVAVTAFYAGQHVWPNKVRPREAPPAGPVSIAPTEAGPAMPKDREVMAALQAPPQSVLHPVSPSSALLTEIDLMIRQGKLLEAQRKLEALGPDALSDMAARSNVATLWNNVGVGQARAAGEMSHGAAAFKNAVTIDPRNATAFMNLVLAYWESKSPALTTEMLEEAARLVPEDPMPHIILAERSIEKDDLSSATAHLELARARSAAFPQSQAYLKSQIDYLERARRSEQKFQSRDSSHFTVKYDGGEDYEVWARVLDILEDAYRDIGRQLGRYPSKPLLVVLHTRETFQSATGGPAWSDGLYDPSLGRIKIPTRGALTDQAWLTRVLRHEYVHAVIDDWLEGRRLPQWLNEGLAMQLANDALPDIPAFVRGEVRLIKLNVLEGPWMGLSSQQALIAYLEGNSATKYLLERHGIGPVRDVLDRVAKGEPFSTAFQDRIFISSEEFERRWIDNLNLTLENART